jgi:predicted N-formylglutamate amidohydrolase
MGSKYRFSMTSDAPFEFISGSSHGLLFLCDHASAALPPEFGDLGLGAAPFETHIAWDIGAAEATRVLAARFEAPAILGRWSRLLVDLNRGEDDPTLVMKLSDGAIVPGNRHADVADRIARFHAPYHARIAAQVARGARAIVSMHSFTPSWKGFARPWELGVLWDRRDARLARPLIERFARAGFTVGDNEPYSGALENDTLHRHATMNRLPHALIEMRQDLVADAQAARAFALRLAPLLEDALKEIGP